MERRRLVAVIGDAGIAHNSEGYRLARETGTLIVDHGHRVVTGGLGGVMEGACRGAHESPAYRDGDTVGILPDLEPDAANDWVDVPIATGLGYARNTLVANSDALIAIGGGAGTLSEIAIGWTLGRPIIAIDTYGWSAQLAGKALDHRRGTRSASPAHIIQSDNPESAMRHLADQLTLSDSARRAIQSK